MSTPEKWLVVAVHGVGDPGGPGHTVDSFAAALAEEAGPSLRLYGEQEVRHLPEADTDPTFNATFPVHVRRADLGGKRLVLAETYWADQARSGEGITGILFALYSLAIRSRHVVTALVGPFGPKEERGLGTRVLHGVLSLGEALLCGCIPALMVLLGGLLALRTLVWLFYRAFAYDAVTATGAFWIVLALGALGAALAVARLLRRRRPGDEPFQPLWISQALASAGLLGLLLFQARGGEAARAFDRRIRLKYSLLATDAALQTDLLRKARDRGLGAERPSTPEGWIDLQTALHQDRRDYPDKVEAIARAAYGDDPQSLLDKLAEVDEERFDESRRIKVGPTQYAGAWRLPAWYASALLEAALWVLRGFACLMVFALALAIGLLFSEPCFKPLLAWSALALQAGMLALFFPSVLVLAEKLSPRFTEASVDADPLVSGGWYLAWHCALGLGVAAVGGLVFVLRRLRKPAGRLIMAWPLQAAVALGFVAGAYPLFDTSWLQRLRAGGILEEMGTALLLLLLLVSSLAALARFALHISTDIVNHFTPPGAGGTRERIVRRLLTLLCRLGEEERPSRVLLVGHSQGTVYAYDLLREASPVSLKGVFLALVTMGSPLEHLYREYFPRQYPPNADPTLGGKVALWLNLHHWDDYVGTTVREAGNAELAVGGGHLRYWVQREVAGRVLSIIGRGGEAPAEPESSGSAGASPSRFGQESSGSAGASPSRFGQR
ncbi:MAG: hypothetical protein K2W96_00455 [Gemmataceae bacterium]|nr:hypothetical protein [Gemmataceae bacterium]